MGGSDPLTEIANRPWNLSMTVHTGRGKETGTFPVLDFSPLRFRGSKHQQWFQRFNEPANPKALLDLIKFAGDNHTLTISKMSDSVSPWLFKAYHHKTKFPKVALHIDSKHGDGMAGILQFAALYDQGLERHNTLFMMDVRITHCEIHTTYFADSVFYHHYFTLRPRIALAFC